MKQQFILAGKLDELGDSLIVARRVSLKAGIGALIAMVLALGLYEARESLSGAVKDEINTRPRAQALSPWWSRLTSGWARVAAGGFCKWGGAAAGRACLHQCAPASVGAGQAR
ncbi:hypothetical protein [Streptomyces sp. NPDC127112]|uniref:hypothetical protein n=1 Tax=Streptomyces sp. NPDC127112 TaxID=3345364 RepID=UPI00363D9A35